MLTELGLEITIWERPIWGLGFIKRSHTWDFTPSESMTDEDVYEWAQRFMRAGADVNVVELKERKCVNAI